jgi:hypothetical protein
LGYLGVLPHVLDDFSHGKSQAKPVAKGPSQLGREDSWDWGSLRRWRYIPTYLHTAIAKWLPTFVHIDTCIHAFFCIQTYINSHIHTLSYSSSSLDVDSSHTALEERTPLHHAAGGMPPNCSTIHNHT